MAIFGKTPAPIAKTSNVSMVGQAAGALVVAHYSIHLIDSCLVAVSRSIVKFNQTRKHKAELKKQEAAASPEVAEATQGAQEAVDPSIFTVDQEVVEAVLRRSEEAGKEEQSEAANG